MGISRQTYRARLGSPDAPRAAAALQARTELRICRFEEMEPRKFLAADVQLGAVYFEDATGDDSQGDTLHITFAGGVSGTELTQLVIDGDKDQNGPTAGDIFFDTQPGGKGAFGSSPLTIVSHEGFQVLGYTVADGGSRIVFDLAGFKAGMKLAFTIDTDEIQYVDASTGAWDINAIVEGGEFQRSHLEGTFKAPGYENATGHAQFWDAYDENFAAEAARTGTSLQLPPDRYTSTGDFVDRTAGAVTSLSQRPLPGSLSGYVHADLDGDCIYDPEEAGIEGVLIDLLDAAGNVLRSTTTDANGQYHFNTVLPGQYQIREHQPASCLDSDDHPGSLGGVVSQNDLISQITVGPGQHGVDYNFCEVPPAMLCGFVYHDDNGNGVKDAGEQGIAGVAVTLRNDAAGVWMTTTDATGRYCFDALPPGTYRVDETQPNGWLDGLDSPGSAGGSALNPGDAISGALLTPGLHAEHYNFGERLPASLRGHVHADRDGDCQRDPGEPGIAGVLVKLYNAAGDLVATTTTDADGNYRFENLAPGEYTVEEIQPDGYFDGGDFVGSAGGVKLANDRIGQIHLASGQHATDYNFCEKPPATLSGFVFQDGGPIQLAGNQNPNIPAIRDGVRSPDDTPLAGVVLELRNGITGEPIYVSALLGDNLLADKMVTAVTDANGHYQFTGLPAGIYAVYQRQDPSGYVDGLNTAGTKGGVAIGAWQAAGGSVIDQLQYPPASGDAILQIIVGAGDSSLENNFSEVVTRDTIIIIENPKPDPQPVYRPGVYLPAAPPPTYAPTPPQLAVPRFLYGGTTRSYSWHLSVIDAGHPRGEQADVTPVQQTAIDEDSPLFKRHALEKARWVLATRNESGKFAEQQVRQFGPSDGIPITGDFDGDGISDLAVFAGGEWHLDADSDGQQDRTDLWARLGSRDDLPVTGDWDGDGKADIGIYGPAWPRDPHAVRHEPGIADAENARRSQPKNPPPQPEHAALGARRLRAAGARSREDLIDHVFHYGTAGDIPIAGDWNGDGIDTIGIFRDGTWRRDTDGDGRTTPKDRSAQFGRAGDLPVTGDWNGDGITDLGIYRGGNWHLDTNGNDRLDDADEVAQLGTTNDRPITGDFDGDGRDDIGIVVGGRIEWRQ